MAVNASTPGGNTPVVLDPQAQAMLERLIALAARWLLSKPKLAYAIITALGILSGFGGFAAANGLLYQTSSIGVPVGVTAAFEPGTNVDVLKICNRAVSVTFAQMPDVSGITRVATGKNEMLTWVDGKDKLGNQLTKATWSYTDNNGVVQPEKVVEVDQPAAECLRMVK